MKKFAKMSLVAALAVAGLSSTVSAQNLAETASEVDVFGYVQIRYNDRQSTVNQDVANRDESNYTHKEVLGATGKINDDLSYMFAGAQLSIQRTDASSTYDGFLMVYNYFTYTGIENTSISAGRQGIASPMTVVYDPATATSEGNGVTATTKIGDVTVTGGYLANHIFNAGDAVSVFPGTAINGSEDFIYVGVTGKVGPVALDAWYNDMDGRYDSFTVGASGKFMAGDVALTPSARYTSADIEGVSADQSLWQVGLGAKAGIFGAAVAYGETDKQGGWVVFDADATAGMKQWIISLNGNADADLIKGNLNVDLTPKLNLSVHAAKLSVANVDTTETFVNLNYKMSSNFSAYVRYGELDLDTEASARDIGRVNLLWLF